jgi:dienelactone hydrolase
MKRIWICFVLPALLLGEKLAPMERGVPAELGGEAGLEQRGSYLWLTARLPEPGGKILARSIGRNPVWEKDAAESPEVEDRVRWRIRYRNSAGVQRDLSIEINPWGAWRIEEAGKITKDPGLTRSAEVTTDGWNVEASVPLQTLDVDWNSASVDWRVERIRSRRALAPEYQWQWPAGTGFANIKLTKNSTGKPPPLRQVSLGNTDPPLQIGRMSQIPPVVANWNDPAWQAVRAFDLSRNEPYPRAPRYRTQIRWMHDGRKLALLARLEEPDPVVARAGGRDAAITGDDHLAVYLATTGSALVEIVVNPVGAIRDSLGTGPRMSQPKSSWNAKVETQTTLEHGYWIARVNIPLDECAAGLGETDVPKQWRILVVRHRAARPSEVAEWSALPGMGGETSFLGPARYQAMELRDEDPARVKLPDPARAPMPQGPAAELAALDSRVWPPLYRRSRAVRTMVQDYLHKKVEQAVLAERVAWEKVNSREEWEQFRDKRIQALKASVGKFPPDRPPLQAKVTARHTGDGYRLENVLFQVRPEYWMPANLYLPDKAAPKVPAIIIVPSQHYPKIQGELHDMGELWARTGSAVLVIERPGYGERTETTPWYRQAYGARYNFSRELLLAGESYSGWAAWDVIRSVDFLYERPEIDRNRIILLGSVAGGGEIAGVAAALDPRIAAVAPFNYDQGHLRVHGDSPGQIAGQFSPWLVGASVAPRKFIRAFEFGWEGAEEPDYPNLWVDGMQRSQKVWGFYDAQENLGSSHGYGLIRLSMERVSHCFSIGPQQRQGLYPLLERWFNIPRPSEKDLSLLPDSGLSVNPWREEALKQEIKRRRPHADLLTITPAASSDLPRKAMHQLAFEMGKEELQVARNRRQALGRTERVAQLRNELKPLLGDIEPVAGAPAERFWTRSIAGTEVEAISLAVEDGIAVPLLLIRPAGRRPSPVVVAIAQEGKDRFLSDRTQEIDALLRSGTAVCLPDVRATGETAPASERGEGGAYQRIAQTEFDLGRSLLGSRLKDLHTVLAYLRSRPDIDGKKLALWGDSFAPPNPASLWLDELEFPGGPQIQHRPEPMGAHLALLAALYEESVRAVVARGGLAGYLSVLENAFAYVPSEDVIFGVLKVGDVADIAGALAPRPLLLEGLVNGRNIRVADPALQSVFNPARLAYREGGAAERLTMHVEPRDISEWLANQLK